MSPCTKNFSLNTSTNICEGCGRTLDEIIERTRMTDEETTSDEKIVRNSNDLFKLMWIYCM